jgi:hypothetical protein
LVLFLVVFWGGLVAAIKIENSKAGKRWSDGPSFVPVIPVFNSGSVNAALRAIAALGAALPPKPAKRSGKPRRAA